MLMPRHQLLCIRIIAVFFVYLLSFATLSAQEVRIVLSGTELPARDLFIQIERQTAYRFAYNSAVFDASQVINLPAAELSRPCHGNLPGYLSRTSGYGYHRSG